MESKGRVIVIDLAGDDQEPAYRAEEVRDHECRCGVCTCPGKERPAPPAPELALQEHGFFTFPYPS